MCVNCVYLIGIGNGKYIFIGNEKYSYFIDSMWKDISAAQAACDSIDNTETVKILDVLENSEGILVSGMGKYPTIVVE